MGWLVGLCLRLFEVRDEIIVERLIVSEQFYLGRELRLLPILIYFTFIRRTINYKDKQVKLWQLHIHGSDCRTILMCKWSRLLVKRFFFIE